MYKSDKYTVYPDRVEQGEFIARAAGPEEMTSDYKSLSAVIDPVIQFKFSINGRDNELPFGVNHQANILPESDETVVLEMTFGQRSETGSQKDASQPLPPNTRVLFRVNCQSILDSFRVKGYYDDILGNRIFKADFRGVFIAGDTYPLNWDFENIPSNPMLRLEDPDGDGIYEKELIFNVYDPSAHTSSTWKPAGNISDYPHFTSPYPLLNALHNMSLDEMVMLMEEDGTFRTGEAWPGVWTRDMSYATMLALAYLDPVRCMNSLMRKVSDNRIIQDTGTGGAWPVSSDRVVWALAAWEIWRYTGDHDWLAKAFEIIRNSMAADSKTIIDPLTGLIRGESSFLDWRKQTYPLWMEPADIYGSLNLGTNAAYCQALKVTGMMAQELGREDEWSDRAENLRKAINDHLWLEEKGYYGQYLYGREYRSLSPRAEALGEAFTVLFDIAGDERKQKVLT
ncbi:MAG: glycogen debranching protein, partial [Bacteroidales bacterium]|nr:glycogen debranching protein [Bacteroidales bacterium]